MRPRRLPIKSDRGSKFFQKLYTRGCSNLQKNCTAGYAIFLHNGLHSKIAETACLSMLALKINHNLGSAF